jgi:hypothetical protein
MWVVGSAGARKLRSMVRRGDECGGVVMIAVVIVVMIVRMGFLGVLIAVGHRRGRTHQGNSASDQRTNQTKARRSSHGFIIA